MGVCVFYDYMIHRPMRSGCSHIHNSGAHISCVYGRLCINTQPRGTHQLCLRPSLYKHTATGHTSAVSTAVSV